MGHQTTGACFIRLHMMLQTTATGREQKAKDKVTAVAAAVELLSLHTRCGAVPASECSVAQREGIQRLVGQPAKGQLRYLRGRRDGNREGQVAG